MGWGKWRRQNAGAKTGRWEMKYPQGSKTLRMLRASAYCATVEQATWPNGQALGIRNKKGRKREGWLVGRERARENGCATFLRAFGFAYPVVHPQKLVLEGV